ncbi:CLP1-like protein [Schizophyllum amplum]|uniref:CLP1-like protein n=1 Tax=Schizophyllum amplum TaxID=97359 RepID=A0A550C9T6_9AGAR|nr:CLP1-like protein [Auriculariopsis ampla]
MALHSILNATEPRRTRASKLNKCTHTHKSTSDRIRVSTKRRTQPKVVQAAAPVKATKPIALPRTLHRPEFQHVSRDALSAVLPQCDGVNAAFVRAHLENYGAHMWNVVSSTRFVLPTSTQLPEEVPITVNNASASAPTHVMAIHGPPAANGVRPVSLYPAHAVVLAAHCARLPAFSPSQAEIVPEAVPAQMTVPVRGVSLPSPPMFGTLLKYLYEKDATALLATLLPVALPNLAECEDFPRESLARMLATTYSSQQLLSDHIHRVHGLWLDVCALGVHDMVLYATMDLAWETLLEALAISTGAGAQ